MFDNSALLKDKYDNERYGLVNIKVPRTIPDIIDRIAGP